MPYSLQKENGYAGDSGQMSMLLIPKYDADGKFVEIEYVHNAKPQIGAAIRVGSLYARSYSAQDWWQTSKIVEILDDIEIDNKNIVKFKTQNSIYIWEKF
jgi:hypothetical protein